MTRRLLYISMLGEPKLYDPAVFTSLCVSGLERDWIVDWHGDAASAQGFDLSAVDICRGEALPEPDSVHAVILGGTLHSVAEDRAWIDDLSRWLLRYRAGGQSLLAICGGHQLIASRLEDGELASRADGPLMGTYDVDLAPRARAHGLFRGLSAAPRFHFGNSEFVQPSTGQTVRALATQATHPLVALEHGGGWYSCQFHPESRKSEFDCYFGNLDPNYESPYAEQHDGAKFMENFFAISAAALSG